MSTRHGPARWFGRTREDGVDRSAEAPPPRAGAVPDGFRRDPAMVAANRRRQDEQVDQLQRSEAHLAERVRVATEAGQPDRVREVMNRLLSVRARLEEVTRRRDALRAEEERLGAGRLRQ